MFSLHFCYELQVEFKKLESCGSRSWHIPGSVCPSVQNLAFHSDHNPSWLVHIPLRLSLSHTHTHTHSFTHELQLVHGVCICITADHCEILTYDLSCSNRLYLGQHLPVHLVHRFCEVPAISSERYIPLLT